MSQDAQKWDETPADWIESNFLVPDPRDPATGANYPMGPIRLAEHQRRIINEALSKDLQGNLKYSTVVFSAPKKSGKSAVTSAVMLYVATHTPNSYVACVANDGQQSTDRLYAPIYTCLRLHKETGGILADESPKLGEVILKNYTKVRAIPCDAAGEAGSQPLFVAYCFDDQTEVLTREGWKKHGEYSMDSELLTLNPATGQAEYQRPVRIFAEQYVGIMHELNTQRVSLCVSPNHKLYGKFAHNMGKDVPFEKKPVERVKDKMRYGVRVESLGVREHGPVPETIVIPGTKRKPALHIPIKLYLRFLGWYLAEGCTHKGDTIMLAQKASSPYYEELKTLIEELGYIPHGWSGTDAVVFYDTRLAKHLHQFGLAHEKFIPDWIKQLPDEYLDILLDTYWRGDGYKTGIGTLLYGEKAYATNSPRLRDDLMEISVRQGKYVTATAYQDKRWGREMFTICVKKWQDGERTIGSKRDQWQEKSYSGVIHCPTVPNGIVCVRRNGKVHWQGQSELWGFESQLKRRMWTEMTLPPTLYGKAMRWVETYAGEVGKAELLEQLYDIGFRQGTPHPDFLDLQGRDGAVVRTNERAKMFVYWDTERRMPWQTDQYYVSEAAILPPSEFERIHLNKWVSPIGAFIQEAWWGACHDDDLPALPDGDKTPVIVGIDMAVSQDCAALVAVTRDPFEPESKTAVRAVRIFNPKASGGVIDQEEMVRPVLEDWARRWNVVCFVYDPREMAKLAQDLVRAGLGWFKPFGQQTPRAVADKQLYDMILHKQVSWNRHTTEGDVGDRGVVTDTLYKHLVQAGSATRGETYRIEKLANSAKIDAAVALSQANYMAMQLAIDNREGKPENLVRQLQKREITPDQFSERMRSVHNRLQERYHERR